MMKIKYCKPAPATLRKWFDANPGKVAEFDCGSGYCFGDGRGFAYDILLAPGWRMDDDCVHTIIEATVADALFCLRRIVPCDCATCQELLAKGEE
jgi:hypothetical protein